MCSIITLHVIYTYSGWQVNRTDQYCTYNTALFHQGETLWSLTVNAYQYIDIHIIIFSIPSLYNLFKDFSMGLSNVGILGLSRPYHIPHKRVYLTVNLTFTMCIYNHILTWLNNHIVPGMWRQLINRQIYWAIHASLGGWKQRNPISI